MYTYYKCAAAKKKKTCDKKAVRKQWLEDLVVNETMKLVEDDASMNAIIAKVMELQNQESTDLPIYEKQLKETEVGITNMLNAIQMGILTSSTKERLEALEEQRKELQACIAEERLAKPKMKKEFVRFWLLRFRKLDMTQPEQRQALVDTFINAIYLYDDKVLITFNYKEGTETVAFGEAVKVEKSSDMSARGAPGAEGKNRHRPHHDAGRAEPQPQPAVLADFRGADAAAALRREAGQAQPEHPVPVQYAPARTGTDDRRHLHGDLLLCE